MITKETAEALLMDKAVGEALIEKIHEHRFATGDDLGFGDGKLPSYIKSQTVCILKRDLERFNDQFSMLAFFAAYVLKKSDPNGFDIMEYIARHRDLQQKILERDWTHTRGS